MNDIKYCKRCGVMISNINTADYYSHISIKYCRKCAEIAARENNTYRVNQARKRKRAEQKQRDIKAQLLEEENELLRRNIIALRESLERMKAEQ